MDLKKENQNDKKNVTPKTPGTGGEKYQTGFNKGSEGSMNKGSESFRKEGGGSGQTGVNQGSGLGSSQKQGTGSDIGKADIGQKSSDLNKGYEKKEQGAGSDFKSGVSGSKPIAGSEGRNPSASLEKDKEPGKEERQGDLDAEEAAE